MQTFDTPNINDFLAQLLMHSDRAVRDFTNQKRKIDAHVSKLGGSNGSHHVLLILDALDEHIESGTAIMLGELRRGLSYPELEPNELRSLTAPRLTEFVDRLISVSGIARLINQLHNEGFQHQIENRLSSAKSRISFWLRQFDIGWDMPVIPETLTSLDQAG
jgi:hypothetical protein